MSTLQRLRAHAISQSLFRPTTLKATIDRLGFVQADPIKSPATAQDLILRQRVKNYRAGDLERLYQNLDIEEDLLYAYGFLPRPVWRLLHPRDTTGLSKLEKGVLEIVRSAGDIHPRELEAHFGRDRVMNAWGGYSKATKCALEDLHYRGLLRIARREKGIRVYQPTEPFNEVHPIEERVRKLAMVVANILAPLPKKSLQETVARVRYSVPNLGNTRNVIETLLRTGELQSEVVDGIDYVWPASDMVLEEVPRSVRILAPFDPMVWDRRRFEHFWGWPYRFEAYVPLSKRVRGYYAMPLLWGDSVIGWANVSLEGKKFNVEIGYVEKRPKDAKFRSELADELGRMETFLNLKL
jgi:uncharacterized protein YcaQ